MGRPVNWAVKSSSLALAPRPGVSAKLFTALADAGVNIRMIDQGSSELNIIIGVDNSDYDDGCTPEYKKEKITFDGKEMGGYFSGLLPGTDYVIKYRLRAYPQIFSYTGTGGEHFFKSILFDDSMLEHEIEGVVDVTTPGDKPTDGAAQY